MVQMARDSEFRTYHYIEEVLKNLGWDTKNPANGGSVYTQGEFRRHDSLLTQALGREAPENIILIPWEGGSRYWIVEAKPTHRGLKKALREAQSYADKVNRIEPGTARFATGIAGTPNQSFYVLTTYWDNSKWNEIAINNYNVTGFLTPEQCRGVLDQNSPNIIHYHVDLNTFLTKANQINETLHNNGVAARDRAKLVSGLLLALAQDSTMSLSNSPVTLIGDVNSRIKTLLIRHGKEDFAAEVQLKLPNTPENHRKYWSAIVLTLQHLREMNIRSAINSGTDALGQFYETFLKYANDASEMGIVLTPRHITKFSVDVMKIQNTDVIFDPTCGTGGFLVAALDSIRASHYGRHPDVYDAFRNDCLFGVEQDDGVFGLALVNMIFRGDGKSRIHNGNCFDNQFFRHDGQILWLKEYDAIPEGAARAFTRVLMNPPFAIEEKEYQFVDYALQQMRVGGLLFAILPNGTITGTDGVHWREAVVRNHTVRAVVKMRDDLFMPNTHKGTYALVLEAWRPHDPVFFAILHDDEHAGRKSKLLGVESTQDNMDRLGRLLSGFLFADAQIDSISKEVRVSTLRMELSYDFAPESYLEGDALTDGRCQSVEGLVLALANKQLRQKQKPTEVPTRCREFELEELFEVKRGKCPPLKYLRKGDVPVITSSEQINGISDYYCVEDRLIHTHCITISANGSEGAGKAFWHPYPFSAVPDVLVCTWRNPRHSKDQAFCLYICESINSNAWRFDYFRKSGLQRIVTDVRVKLPMKPDGTIDRVVVRRIIKRSSGYYLIKVLHGYNKSQA